MIFLKQSTAYTAKIGPFIDSTDGSTAEVALVISQADVRLSKNGGDIAQKTEATSCTHDELGYYDCPLDATDTGTLGKLQLFVHESGALPVFHEFMVLPANVYDSLFSTDKLEVDVAQWLGTAAATPTVAGVPEVDVTHWIGTAAATPTTAGVPEVDLTYIAGAAVATGTAQLGVNVVSVTNDAITAAAIANGAIDAATFAAGAITAAAIATDAIDADAIAADGLAEIADAVWDEATSGHVASGSFGQRLAILRSGTAQAGAADAITLDAGASAINDFYNYALIVITGGTGVGQCRTIAAYVGATKVATITPGWATNPDVTSVFTILPVGYVAGATAPTTGQISTAVWGEVFDGIKTSFLLRIAAAGAGGAETAGMATANPIIRDIANTKDMIALTVDADGNRTHIVLTE